MEHGKNDTFPQTDPSEESFEQVYEIRVKGSMDAVFWADWFGGMEFSLDSAKEETILRGPLSDQAELYGLLTRLRNKGLALISVHQIYENA